jgi:hypothetical protein
MNENLFRGYGVEIELPDPESFLKIKETLTRIGISSKKDNILYQSCLPGFSVVDTEDGPKTIRDIVENQYQGRVKSIDQNGKVVWNKVVAHQQVKNTDKTWVILVCSDLKSQKRLGCTDDHLVGVVSDCMRPKIEFLPAKDALGKYLVRNVVSGSNQMHNVSALYNSEQIEFLVGTLLGDSTVTHTGSIQNLHCIAQEGYIKLKQQIFGGNVRYLKNNRGFGKGDNPSANLQIKSNQQTKHLRSLMFQNGNKSVKNVLQFFTEKSLAFFYMDDGNLSRQADGKYHAMFNTQGFSYEDNVLLQTHFKEKFNIESKIDTYKTVYKNEEKVYHRIRLGIKDTEKMLMLISPYVPDCMLYKLGNIVPSYSHEFDCNMLDFAVTPIVKIDHPETPKYKSSLLYDIQVENTSNFMANDSLVHNCHILHKKDRSTSDEKSRYAIMHFKELFILDGKSNNLEDDDIARRNTIVNLLEEWNLLTVVNPEQIEDPVAPLSKIKILPHKEKASWKLEAKYTVGIKKGT